MFQSFIPQYAAPWVAYVVAVLLITAVGIALYYDLKWRIIPNWLTYGGILIGFLLNGVLAGSSGLISAAVGMIVASIFFVPLFFMGGFGGGDVKLMAALGTLGGACLAANILFITACAGGLLGLVQISAKKSWRNTFHRLGLLFRLKTKELEAAPEEEQLSMPYGIAMAIGTITTVILQFTDNLLV